MSRSAGETRQVFVKPFLAPCLRHAPSLHPFPRMQREQAELEQNFAREISNLVQRLSAEKDQLEAELRLKMDQEVMLVRWVVTSWDLRCLLVLVRRQTTITARIRNKK